MNTFAHDHTLPALPIPALEATCGAIPRLVAPLVSPDVLAKTQSAVAEFANGTGRVLHSALLDRKAAMPGNESWLRPFWDAMYTRWRDPLPLTLNYYLEFTPERWGGAAALPGLIRSLAVVLRSIGTGELEPERTKAGYQAMDQAFTCVYTRVPGQADDTLVPVNLVTGRTIAVTSHGHWFTMPVFENDGSPATPAAIGATLSAIKKVASSLPPAPPVSAFTAMPRAEAAAVRAAMGGSVQNSLSLAALEQSLFVVCLDPAHASPEDLALRLVAGDAASRWFDKSLQLVGTENGGLGANFEHAGCDAGMWLYLFQKADEHMAASAGEKDVTKLLPFSLRNWETGPEITSRLEKARTAFAGRARGMAVACRSFPALARKELRTLDTSPDAFLQICFQAAQYHVFGRLRSSYEAVSARGFFQGRTECARGSTQEALEFARALAGTISPPEILELYRAAEIAHLDRLKQCQKGRGVERHISGLEAVFSLYGNDLGVEAPRLFTDEGWRTLKHDAVSTSGIGAPFIRFFGFPPVTRDGLGVGYAPGQEATGLAVTSFADGPATAGDFLESFVRASDVLVPLLREQKRKTASQGERV